MAKRKSVKRDAAPSIVEDERDKNEGLLPSAESGPAVYAFPNKSRCPRCGSISTEAYSVMQETQYRRCRVAVCRNRYKVVGTTV